jgi:hypothetical protein
MMKGGSALVTLAHQRNQGGRVICSTDSMEKQASILPPIAQAIRM